MFQQHVIIHLGNECCFGSLEVIVFELAHVAADPVLSECHELVVILELHAEGHYCEKEVEVDKVRVEVELRSNMR